MTSKRRLEGYLYIDNGGGAAPAPVSAGRRFITAGRDPLERNTLTCSHCQRQLLVNIDRTRAREWCWNCDKYLCDQCAAIRKIAGCKTFQAISDQAELKAIRSGETNG